MARFTQSGKLATAAAAATVAIATAAVLVVLPTGEARTTAAGTTTSQPQSLTVERVILARTVGEGSIVRTISKIRNQGPTPVSNVTFTDTGNPLAFAVGALAATAAGQERACTATDATTGGPTSYTCTADELAPGAVLTVLAYWSVVFNASQYPGSPPFTTTGVAQPGDASVSVSAGILHELPDSLPQQDLLDALSLAETCGQANDAKDLAETAASIALKVKTRQMTVQDATAAAWQLVYTSLGYVGGLESLALLDLTQCAASFSIFFAIQPVAPPPDWLGTTLVPDSAQLDRFLPRGSFPATTTTPPARIEPPGANEGGSTMAASTPTGAVVTATTATTATAAATSGVPSRTTTPSLAGTPVQVTRTSTAPTIPSLELKRVFTRDASGKDSNSFPCGGHQIQLAALVSNPTSQPISATARVSVYDPGIHADVYSDTFDVNAVPGLVGFFNPWTPAPFVNGSMRFDITLTWAGGNRSGSSTFVIVFDPSCNHG